MLLPCLGGATRALTYHEVLFAQPAKEMLATGNWVLPKFAGIPSTHKPPGAHWAIAVAMLLTGSEAEAIARLPAALAGVATALLVAVLAARWFGPRVGLVAGLAQPSMYYVLQLARLAECDMLLTLAVTGAMACFAVANVEGPCGRSVARRWPWLFYGCTTLAFFFKGLIGPAFVLSGCGAYALIGRDWRGLKFLLNPLGVAGFLVSTVAWLAAAYWQYPPILEHQVMHHFGRFQGDMGGKGDAFFYAYSVPLILLPCAPLVIYGVIRGVRLGLYTLPWWRFTTCWMIPGLLLLNLSSFKSKHYAAPLMPPLTIVAALVLLAWLRPQPSISRRSRVAWAAVSVASAALAVVAGAVGLAWTMGDEARTLVGLGGIAAAGAAAVFWCRLRQQNRAALGAVFGTAWIVIVGTLAFVIPQHDSYRGQTELAQRINQLVPGRTPLCLVNLPANGENQIVYYLRQELWRYDRWDDFQQTLPSGVETFVLAPLARGGDLAQLGEVKQLDLAPARRKQPEAERLTLYRLTSRPTVAAAARVPDSFPRSTTADACSRF
jgi:4-amino-4-deoxy-L-arabinose transferase-like glycosyltransferase